MSTILEQYYTAFNRGDTQAMLALLSDDVLHEPCQGQPRHGKALFAEFLAHMDRCYKEQVINPQILYAEDGSRASAEFRLEGTYLQTDEPLPPAHGQTYVLRVGTFFELKNGKICRVSNHYNLQHWIDQISH
jgi:steroid delta-isomerase-like uncharacterized protein